MKKYIFYLGLFLLYFPDSVYSQNNGQGGFELLDEFTGIRNASVSFADFNLDGYFDFVISGQNESGENIAEVYTNDGEGGFSLSFVLPGFD
ncbi:MAG: hypothetical protein ACFCU6_14640 [Balneolaceae bacterium]